MIKNSIFIIFFFYSNSIFAAINHCDGTVEHPCIVQDTQYNQLKLKNFRTTSMLKNDYSGNTTGLAELWLSGGSASSARDWHKIYKLIKIATHNKVKTIIDLDLRQESHGYLNNNAINLTAQSNWININKSHDEILIEEKRWLKSLKLLNEIPNVLQPKQFKSNQFNSGKNISVLSIQDEESLVKQIGFHYIRLTVTDHQAPSDIEVDRFVNLVRTLKKGTWLHIHCRGGDGRTTTFMAMMDMLRNADKVAFIDIINRQAASEPFYNLSQVERKHPEFTVYYKKRFEFLNEFYQYAQDYLNGYTGDWSSWKSKRPDY